MATKEINFDSFWKLKNNHLSAFNAYWEKQVNRHASDCWPRYLSEATWEEQFSVFIDTIYNPSVDKNGYYRPW